MRAAHRRTGTALRDRRAGPGIPVFRYSGIPVFRYSGIPVFRYSGIPVFRWKAPQPIVCQVCFPRRTAAKRGNGRVRRPYLCRSRRSTACQPPGLIRKAITKPAMKPVSSPTQPNPPPNNRPNTSWIPIRKAISVNA
jgi:hypothetical protein